MLRMIKNPDEVIFNTVKAAIDANDGFCPCRIERTSDTKCPCKDFRNQTIEGECHCGAFVKILEVENE